jgi:hypothetical protein
MYSLALFNPAFIRAFVDSPVIVGVCANDDMLTYLCGGYL